MWHLFCLCKFLVSPSFWTWRSLCFVIVAFPEYLHLYSSVSFNNLSVMSITKTCLYIFDPLKPYFYIVKLGFTGVYIIFLIFAQKHRLWYSLEPPRRGGSNEYPQSMFWAKVWKISVFYLNFFQFLEVNFSIYLNRRVFVMRDGMGELMRIYSAAPV